jgi:UDP-N-acetyl-2-amino-2-deoxyglucuronate dehydrogenase
LLKNFAVIGVAGFIAPRHLKAIKDTGNRIVAATDPHDSVGILDKFFFDVKYFPEIERFDRNLEKLRRGPPENQVHYVSICSPNYLHDAHIRLALRTNAHAICEKPIVINPWNLDLLEEIEKETGKKVYTVLQLRVHPSLIALKQKLSAQLHDAKRKADICLTYITSRGNWYFVSWKGSQERSGGLAVNIGIHFFDLLIWLFGNKISAELHLNQVKRMGGFIELEHAWVRWFLSADMADLPAVAKSTGKTTFRSITIDGEDIDFSEGFSDLHTRVYEDILSDLGCGIAEARPSIELVHAIRHSKVKVVHGSLHPMLIK